MIVRDFPVTRPIGGGARVAIWFHDTPYKLAHGESMMEPTMAVGISHPASGYLTVIADKYIGHMPDTAEWYAEKAARECLRKWLLSHPVECGFWMMGRGIT